MKKVIVIVGPTAVGKSHIGIELAKLLHTDIISGDSVQVFKGLDIGSGKVTEEEMDGVKHYLLDILEPNQEYSVADFQKESRKLYDKISLPLVVGGTGLYIKASLTDYDFSAPKRDFNNSEKYQDLSNEELYKILLEKDKEQANIIHPNNRKRVLRAIENATNDNLMSEKNGKDTYLYDPYIIYLNLDREVLYERINKRVDMMFDLGLEKEVKDLYDNGIMPHAIGYQEFIPYFLGSSSLDDVKEEIKKNSRHLAKRQMTWFNNQMQSHFYLVNLSNIKETVNIIYKDVLEFLER